MFEGREDKVEGKIEWRRETDFSSCSAEAPSLRVIYSSEPRIICQLKAPRGNVYPEVGLVRISNIWTLRKETYTVEHLTSCLPVSLYSLEMMMEESSCCSWGNDDDLD